MAYRNRQYFLALLMAAAVLSVNFQEVEAKLKQQSKCIQHCQKKANDLAFEAEDIWLQQESLEEIQDQIKWGMEQSSRMDKKKKADTSKDDKKDNSVVKTCTTNCDSDYEAESTCDHWYCTEEQKQIIMQNSIFSLMMLLVIPLSLLLEKIYRKVGCLYYGKSKEVQQKPAIRNDVEVVANKMLKIRRRLKVKSASVNCARG